MAVDKVKWLKEHGNLPQFGTNINFKVDRQTGKISLGITDKMHMKAKTLRDKVEK